MMDIKKTWKEKIVEVLREQDKPMLMKELCESYFKKYPTKDSEDKKLNCFRYNLSIAVKHGEIVKRKLKKTYNYYLLPNWNYEGKVAEYFPKTA